MLTPPHTSLRAWRASDLDRYLQIHADHAVTDWLGGAMSAEQAAALFDRDRFGLEQRGWGVWAVQDESGDLVGAAGLQEIRPGLPFHPAVEAVWRLSPAAQGKGLITQAMERVLNAAFERIEADAIYAMTAATNLRSRAVMTRLGFEHLAGSDFDHPRLAEGHPLRRHVIYRLRA